MGKPGRATLSLVTLWHACCHSGWALLLASPSEPAPPLDFYAPEPDELDEPGGEEPEAALQRDADLQKIRGRAGLAAEFQAVEEQLGRLIDVELFRRRAVSGRMAITTVSNMGYWPVLKNWLEAIDALQISGVTSRENVTVVCTDRELQNTMRSLGYETQLLEPDIANLSSSFNDISFFRHYVSAHLNMKGLDVLYTDADAVWLQNPLPELLGEISQDGKPGVIASRGQYPNSIFYKWGATLCTGVLLYYGRLPQQFWIGLNHARKTINDGHDQHYLNQLLYDTGVVWSAANSMIGYKEAQKADHGYCAALDMHVTLLAYNEYPRVCDNLTRVDVKVLHCLRGKAAEQKALRWEERFAWS